MSIGAFKMWDAPKGADQFRAAFPPGSEVYIGRLEGTMRVVEYWTMPMSGHWWDIECVLEQNGDYYHLIHDSTDKKGGSLIDGPRKEKWQPVRAGQEVLK